MLSKDKLEMIFNIFDKVITFSVFFCKIKIFYKQKDHSGTINASEVMELFTGAKFDQED